MKSFLKIIAEGYFKRYSNLSNLLFVLPNKRSGTFLLREFAGLVNKPVLSPGIMPVSEFIMSLTDKVVDSRLDLLFRLYTVYKTLPGAQSDLPFEKFTSWGETVLSDFDELDMQMVDVEKVFKNVYDINAIKSNFLSENHKRVMVEYFNYSPERLIAEYERFWQSFNDFETEGKNKGLRKKFLALWQLFHPLYEGFKSHLAQYGLITEGGSYREVAEAMESGKEPFEGMKLVFVGFNALSESENRLFRALRDMEIEIDGRVESKADFIWDKVSEVLVEDDEPAQRFLSINSREDNFPPPAWMEELLKKSRPTEIPEIQVIAVPSNVMQAKVAGAELQKLISDSEGVKDIERARIAVVLPEESLLLPMLFSIPKEIEKLNLTMGFPLKQTPVIGFAALLKKLHQNGKKTKNSDVFFFDDVKDLLSHPYARLLFKEESISRFIKAQSDKRNLVVTSKSLMKLGDIAGVLFRLFPQTEHWSTVIDYIIEVMKLVKEALKAASEPSLIHEKVERVYVESYIDALYRLRNCMTQFDVSVSTREIFSLAERLISGEKVSFEGKPLEGLQVMGVLETRCLDFDRIIMLSMNEKIMPRVGRNSSFIPNIIRSAFWMPPANYQEEIFAYYFFRVIGRSRHAVLTYDSRASENRTPGPSRYILQMKYLTPKLNIREEEIRFKMPHRVKGNIVVPKDGEIGEALRKYLKSPNEEEAAKKFSASTLSDYFNCQLRFLFRNVLGLKVEQEKLETIDAMTMGTIVHRAIERLYFPEKKQGIMLESPILMTKSKLSGLLDEKSGSGETRIEREARRAILEVHFNVDEKKSENESLRGSAAIIFDYIVRYIRNIIRADILRAPFRLWGSEIVRLLDYQIPDGPKVTFKMVIDRLDQQGESGNHQPFRIVDYKTGNVHLQASNLEQVMDGTYAAKNIFQLLFYGELLIKSVNEGKIKLPEGVGIKEFEKSLKTVIYKIIDLPFDGVLPPEIDTYKDEKEKEKPYPIDNMSALRRVEEKEGVEFMQLLDTVLKDILDISKPFEGEPEEEKCRYCEFRLRCEYLRALQNRED